MSNRWVNRFTRIGGNSPNGLGNLLFKENQRRSLSGISPECIIQTAQIEPDGNLSIVKSFGKYRNVVYNPTASAVAKEQDALVFHISADDYSHETFCLAKLTTTGYKILYSIDYVLPSGWVIGIGWHKVTNEFLVIIEDADLWVKVLRISTTGVLNGVLGLMAPAVETYDTLRGFYDKISGDYYVVYIVIADCQSEYPWYDPLYYSHKIWVYYNRFNAAGVQQVNWSKMILFIAGTNEIIGYVLPSILKFSSIITIGIGFSYYYYTESEPGYWDIYHVDSRTFILSDITGDTIADYITLTDDFLNGQSPVEKIGDNIYTEISISPASPSPEYSGLYITNSSYVSSQFMNLNRDSGFFPWISTNIGEQGLFITEWGPVVNTTTGTVLYSITELSTYMCWAMAGAKYISK